MPRAFRSVHSSAGSEGDSETAEAEEEAKDEDDGVSSAESYGERESKESKQAVGRRLMFRVAMLLRWSHAYAWKERFNDHATKREERDGARTNRPLSGSCGTMWSAVLVQLYALGLGEVVDERLGPFRGE